MISFAAEGEQPTLGAQNKLRVRGTVTENEETVHVNTKLEFEDTVQVGVAGIGTVQPFDAETLERTQISLLESGQYSDLKIECNGFSWYAHRCILGPRVASFATSAWSILRVLFGCKQGAIINLDEHDPGAVYSMLGYLYSKELKYESGLQTSEAVERSLALMKLADHYTLPDLASKAFDILESYIHLSEGQVLHQVVPAMYDKNATMSVTNMRDKVIDIAAILLNNNEVGVDPVLAKLSINYGTFTVAASRRSHMPARAEQITPEEVDDSEEEEEEEDEEDDFEYYQTEVKPKKSGRATKPSQNTGKVAASQKSRKATNKPGAVGTGLTRGKGKRNIRKPRYGDSGMVPF